MCDHEWVVYIGEQELMEKGTISLYNCVDCMTTITENSLTAKSSLKANSLAPISK